MVLVLEYMLQKAMAHARTIIIKRVAFFRYSCPNMGNKKHNNKPSHNLAGHFFCKNKESQIGPMITTKSIAKPVKGPGSSFTVIFVVHFFKIYTGYCINCF